MERIILVNAPPAWEWKSEVRVTEDGKGERKVRFRYEAASEGRAAWAVVRDPGVGVARGWGIEI